MGIDFYLGEQLSVDSTLRVQGVWSPLEFSNSRPRSCDTKQVIFTKVIVGSFMYLLIDKNAQDRKTRALEIPIPPYL